MGADPKQVAPRLAAAAGALAALIGSGHIVVWVAGLAGSISQTTIFMKTNAALGIVVCGLGLIAVASRRLSPARRRFAVACGVFALLLGGLTLAEHLFGWDLGIDQLLAIEHPGAAATASPNRMGPPAALSLVLLGTALLILGSSSIRRRAWHQPFALAVALLSLLSIIGYLYEASALYHITRLTAIAWPTAVSLLLLATGVICARPDEGVMARITADDPGGTIVRMLLGVMVLVPLLLGWVRLTGERLHWFDAAMGTSLMMLLFIVIFSLLLLFAGRRVGDATVALRDAERETRGQKDLLAVTLASIGDAVIVTDAAGMVTFLNAEAARLTGWARTDALGKPLTDVFSIVNEKTRAGVDNPVEKVLRLGEVVGLANHTVLIAKDGRETPIDDSGAPIRTADGEVKGVVLVFRDITERRRAEQALQRATERERFLADVVENGSTPFGVGTPDGRLSLCNRAFLDLTGYSRGELEQSVTWARDLTPPEWRQIEAEKLGEAVRRRESVRYEKEYLRKDGSRVPVELFVQPVFAEDGTLVHYRSFLADITDRKHAEEAHARLAAIVETSDDAILSEDVTGIILTWNHGAERMFGYSAAEAVGRPVAMLIPQDRLQEEDRILEQVAAGERIDHYETERITKGGDRRTVSITISPLRGSDGKVVGASKILRDMTERRRAAAALRESEGRLRLATSAADLGVFEWDVPSDIARWENDRMFEIFGRLRSEGPIGRDAFYAEALEPEDRVVFDQALADAMRPEALFRVSCRIRRRNDHEQRWIEYAARFDLAPDGSPKRLVGVIKDITERKRAEEELREANERLVDADRGKDQFLAVLSHELRNPLAAVRTAVHLLEHVPPAGEHANRATRVIDRQTAQLTRLVDDLLDVTRISRGKIQIQVEPVELTGLVRRTAEDHRALFATSGIEFELQVPDDPLWVNGDAQRLAQAVGNLLHNAAKFTERGGRTVALLGKDDDGREAVITVRDSGVGISAQALPHLFQPFMQLEDTLDRARGGLGLGLALVKSLVEMHGGTVSARSAGAGLGSEFTLRLPLRSAPPDVSVVAESAVHRRRRVLIIEDNVDAADSLRHALALAGHDVEVAYDGREGVEKAREFAPEIVLCDIGLPGLNGYDVARTLRNDATLASVRLVALTGYALPDDVAKAREAGFDLHLAKPASPEKLRDALR